MQTSQSTTSVTISYTVATESATAPNVEISNHTFYATSGVPFSIVFSATSTQSGEFYWAIATYDPQLAFTINPAT